MKKSTANYLRSVRSSFPVYQKNEKRFFCDFTQTISEYESMNPYCCTTDLVEKFGTPKEVVIDYFNSMDSANYISLLKKSFYIKFVTWIITILLFVFFLIQTYSLYHVRKVAMETIITTEDITISYETN